MEKKRIVQFCERVLMPRDHPFSGPRLGIDGTTRVDGETFLAEIARVEPLYQVPLSDGRLLIGLRGIAQQRATDLWVVMYDEWAGNHRPSKEDGGGRKFVRRDGSVVGLGVPIIWQQVFTIERVLVNLYGDLHDDRKAEAAQTAIGERSD